MNRLQTSLFNVSLRVFEDLGFLLPSPVLNEEQEETELGAAVAVEFTGPAKGTLLLSISGQVLSTLASNMLGEDVPPPEPQLQDALREVANVICGNLLPDIAGPEAVFDIGAPRVGKLQDLQSKIQGRLAARQAIGLEDGRADIQLFLSEDSLWQEVRND